MLCNQAHPKTALKGDKSSTTKNCLLRVIGLAWIGSAISPMNIVEAPLNPDNIRPEFSKLEGMNPICFITDTCKSSVELPGSTIIHLTLKSPIPSVRIWACRCGYNTWTGSTGGKMITPSIG